MSRSTAIVAYLVMLAGLTLVLIVLDRAGLGIQMVGGFVVGCAFALAVNTLVRRSRRT